MYRVIKGSTSGNSIVPAELSQYFQDATVRDAIKHGFDMSADLNLQIQQDYEDEGLKYLGFIIAKPEYFDALEDSGMGLLDVVSENGHTFAAMMSGGRIYEVDASEIESYL